MPGLFDWWTRLRLWFASLFGPRAASGCPLTGGGPCPAEKCPKDCPNCQLTGTPECPADKICDHCAGCVSDGGEKSADETKAARLAVCPKSARRPESGMPPRAYRSPAGSRRTSNETPDGPDTLIIHEGPLLIPPREEVLADPDSFQSQAAEKPAPAAVTISDTFGSMAHAIHEAAASVPELPASLPEAPAPHVPESPPPSPPAYDPGPSSSYDCGGSADAGCGGSADAGCGGSADAGCGGSADAGCGGGGDF